MPLPIFLKSARAPNGENCSPYKFEMNSTATGQVFSYSWQVDSDQDWDFIEGTTSESADPKFIFYGGGEYKVKLSAANSCATAEWDTTIVLEGRPTAVLDIPNFCDEAEINFDNSIINYGDNGYSIDNYDWTFEGAETTSSTDANPTGIRYTQAGEYVVKLRTSNTCGSVTVRDTFLIQPKDNLNLPPDQTVCSTEPAFNLSAGLQGGRWTGSGVYPNGFYDPASAQAGANVLTYSFGMGVCFIEDQMTITVNPPPTLDLGPELNLCTSDQDVQLSGAPAGGTWTGSEGAVLLGNTFSVRETPAGEYQLRYAFTDANGCSAIDSISVTLTDGPLITASDTSYCNTPKDQVLPPVSINGGTWAGIGVVEDEMFNPFVAGGAGIYDLTYSFTDKRGCSAVVPVKVSVVDPIKVDAGGELIICEASEILFLDSLATPPGGIWRFDNQPLFQDIFDPNQADNGIYKFSYSVGNGVCIVTDTLEISIDEQQEFELGADESVCANGEAFELGGTGGLDGIWSGEGVVDSLTGLFDPTDLAPGDYTVTFLRQEQDIVCPGVDDKIVTVNPLPASLFSIPSVLCLDTEFSPTNESDGADSFLWNFGDGTTNANSNATHTYTTFGSYEISLETSNSLGCIATYRDTIEVAPPPSSGFDVVDNEGCGPFTLEFNNTSSGADITYEWDFGNGQTSTRPIPLEPVIYQTNRRDTSFIISLRTSNACGSDISRDTIQIFPFPLADFGFSVDTGCAPISVAFANISQGSPETYFWDFGNGVTSTDLVPAPSVIHSGRNYPYL